MKNIKTILIIILIITIQSCGWLAWEDLRGRGFEVSNCYNYYPKKDTFSLGDTLWLQFSFPKNLKIRILI
jgi:hypothetical protein